MHETLVSEENSGILCEKCEVERKATNEKDRWMM